MGFHREMGCQRSGRRPKKGAICARLAWGFGRKKNGLCWVPKKIKTKRAMARKKKE